MLLKEEPANEADVAAWEGRIMLARQDRGPEEIKDRVERRKNADGHNGGTTAGAVPSAAQGGLMLYNRVILSDSD
jgi:hypothetical protein